MFDVHYHLIFDVDDGPKTLEDSLALAAASIAEGVTHVVATPHASFRYKFLPEVNQERIEILNQHLKGSLTLGLGCDFHLSQYNIDDLHKNPQKYAINNKRYLLAEFADYAIPASMSDVFYDIISEGLVPVITHPERNPVLGADLDRIKEWIDIGCLVQITAGSLRGRFGPKAKSVALNLLRKNQVHVVASDAHSMRGRPPCLKKAHELLSSKFGKELADRLCIENPRAVFLGEDLPPLREKEASASTRESRGFLEKLFGN